MKWAGTQFFFFLQDYIGTTEWPETWQEALWIAKDPKHLQADSEDSDQTARMRSLIWVFAVRTCNLAGNTVARLKIIKGLKPSKWATERTIRSAVGLICAFALPDQNMDRILKGNGMSVEKCIWDKIFWQIMHFDVNLIKIRQKLIPLSKASPLWIFKDV